MIILNNSDGMEATKVKEIGSISCFWKEKKNHNSTLGMGLIYIGRRVQTNDHLKISLRVAERSSLLWGPPAALKRGWKSLRKPKAYAD